MKRSAIFFPAILLATLAISACNLQLAPPETGDAVGTAVAQTMVAQTGVARIVASTLGALVTDTPISTPVPSQTPLPSATPLPSFTPTLPIPMISVSVDTNCRTGPGKAYDMVGALSVGQKAEVLGRDGIGQYWLIRDPKDPTNICWLWGYYATITGDTSRLPVATPPPSPTPAPAFTFAYNYWGVGPGYQCFKFDVRNTGSVTWESFAITLHNGPHATNVTGSSNDFINYDNWCVNAGSQSDLMPGEGGTASVKTFLAYNPVGATFDATLKLCSENGLGGICTTRTITFSP